MFVVDKGVGYLRRLPAGADAVDGVSYVIGASLIELERKKTT